MEIKDLKPYHKNPRILKEDKAKLLFDSLEDFGDLSGIVVNRLTGEVIGGNQRTNFFKMKDAKIVLTEEFEKATKQGTVATGYVIFSGERYSVRIVEWDAKRAERANILANKVSGEFNYEILANEFDQEMLLESGFTAGELGFGDVPDFRGEVDKDNLGNSMDSYLDGNIRQVVLFFKVDEYEDVVRRLDAVMAKEEVASHTEAVLKLLESYENAGA